MADWQMQAVIVILVGYQMCVFGTVTSGGDSNCQPLFIIAFLLFTPAALLTALVKLGEISHNVIINICNMVMLGTAGVFLFIGVAVWGGDYDNGSVSTSTTSLYANAITLDITASFLALLGTVYLILATMCGGGGGAGGGGGRDSAKTAPAESVDA